MIEEKWWSGRREDEKSYTWGPFLPTRIDYKKVGNKQGIELRDAYIRSELSRKPRVGDTYRASTRVRATSIQSELDVGSRSHK
jgi:hypothetical protein